MLNRNAHGFQKSLHSGAFVDDIFHFQFAFLLGRKLSFTLMNRYFILVLPSLTIQQAGGWA
jgi:hypothetical protein